MHLYLLSLLRRSFILFIVVLYTSNSFAVGIRPLNIMSSSTAYPLIALAAERFGQGTEFRSPIVESAGTGAAFNAFCMNNTNPHYDMIVASREIRESELKRCNSSNNASNKDKLEKMIIGYDGIILVNGINDTNLDLSTKEIFNAIGAFALYDGNITKNYYKKWSQISKNLPDRNITVYGPASGSGTKQVLIDRVIIPECMSIYALRSDISSTEEAEGRCSILRTDGVYIEYQDNMNLVMRKIIDDSSVIAIVNYNVYLYNKDKLQIISIDGVAPTKETILSNKYLLSRPIYLYYWKNAVPNVTGFPEFLRELTSEHALGSNGYLTKAGLIKE